MTAIIPFKFGASEIRVVDQSGEPWFVLVDVCNTLEIQNPSQAANGLGEDERSMFNIGRQGSAIIVNESGLWAVALTSRKPEAKKFRKWLTSEVIPSIRKTGAYSARVLTPAEQNLANAQLAVEFERRLAAVEAQDAATAGIAAKALTIAEHIQRHVEIAGPHDESQYSMSAYCEFRGASWNIDTLRMLGYRASRLCREKGVLPGKTKHDRFNTCNTYPIYILEEIFQDFVQELGTYGS
jgi:prophage antirepressor-like protein